MTGKNGKLEREYKRDGRAPIPERESTSVVMSANRGKDTGPEMMLRVALRENGLAGYRLHWKNAPGRPDIAYPGRKVAIFVHGDFWHRCPTCNLPLPKTHTEFWEQKLDRNVKRDQKKKTDLEIAGWKVVICWEHEIKQDVVQCVGRIKKVLQEGR